MGFLFQRDLGKLEWHNEQLISSFLYVSSLGAEQGRC